MVDTLKIPSANSGHFLARIVFSLAGIGMEERKSITGEGVGAGFATHWPLQPFFMAKAANSWQTLILHPGL